MSDRRLRSQLTLLSVLVVLPAAMIATNGARTMQALLWAGPETTPGAGSGSVIVSPQRSHSPPLKFGVYDPGGVFSDDKALELRHIYLSWVSINEQELLDRLKDLEQRGFQPLLTIEPWPQPGSSRPLLPSVASGDYDQIIERLASVLDQVRGPVYVSWGHEMDQDLTVRYPWSGSNPEQFVAAYRHVVDRIRHQVHTPISWVWAAVLKEGSHNYWPGDAYADFIGTAIYSYPDWDRASYGHIRDFQTTFEEKRKIAAKFDKPLMITELGVAGSPDFQAFWLHQAFLHFDQYPDLAGIIFFHAKDADGAWGANVRTPDWRQEPSVILSLAQWKRQGVTGLGSGVQR